MASLAELLQRAPNQDTNLVEAIAKYREAMSNQNNRQGEMTRSDREASDTQYVPLSTFMDFRRDVYLYISQIAEMTRLGLEELQKLLNAQQRDTETLRRYEMEREENELEKKPGLLERAYEGVKEKVKNNKGNIAGILGLLAFAGFMNISESQFTSLGETIDELISTVRDGLTLAAGVAAAAFAARQVFNRMTGGGRNAPQQGQRGSSGTTGSSGRARAIEYGDHGLV